MSAAPERAYAQADSAVIESITVEGNQRIEVSTIASYLGLSSGQKATRADVNRGLKKLFETGFFADVSLEQRGNTLVVKVIENPSINQVAFEGNKKLDDDELKKEVTLRARSIYTRTKIQQDVKRLLDVYRRTGRYSATVEPKLIPLEQNRVNLVFEINEGPVTKIERIRFIGNENYSASKLNGIISSEETRFYKFLTDADKYDPERVLYDKELLRRFYTSEGYADFAIKATIAELTPTKEAFYITYVLEEGPRYNFGSINVKSNLKGEKAPDLSEAIITKQGEHYNADEVDTTIDNMVKELGNLGYAFVDIDPQLERNKEAGIINLTYQIEEGPRVYIERINIVGNVRTLDEVIRREFRLAEGDAYSASKLRRSEQRLKNLGFFEDLKISNEPGSAPDKTVINVEAEEKSTGEIQLGAGFSTVDGALADISVRERNLLGRGQDLRVRLLLAAERQQFDIGFTEPYFLSRELAAGFDIYRTTYDFSTESSFDREATGLNLRSSYALGEKLAHSVNYSIDETEITDIGLGASRFIRDQEGKNVTSMVGQALTYDDRDNKFDPTEGLYFKVSQDIAGLGGDSQFLRHDGKASYYVPVAPKWVLAFSGGAGHIQPIGDDDVRINHRFFIGSREIRGFDNAGIGPRDIVTEDALGGNIYYTASTEMMFPLGLPEELGFQGAVFLDAGNLYDSGSSGPDVADSSSLRASAGVGVAWASPFGPIRLDLAKPVAKEEYDIEEFFRFSFGTRF